MSLDAGLNLRNRSDDQRHLQDTLLFQDLFLLLPLLQLLDLPSASPLAIRFRLRNLIQFHPLNVISVRALLEPS